MFIQGAKRFSNTKRLGGSVYGEAVRACSVESGSRFWLSQGFGLRELS